MIWKSLVILSDSSLLLRSEGPDEPINGDGGE